MIETPFNIELQKSKFSPRIFLFIVFGLAIIILSIELGYFMGFKSNPKITEVTPTPIGETSRTLQPEIHVYGRVKEIDGKNLLLEEKDERFWLTLKEPIRVIIKKAETSLKEIEKEATIPDVEKEQKGLKLEASFEGKLEDLRVGDLVFVGGLSLDGTAEHFLTGSLVGIIRE